jgi:hypothetical protein
VSGRAGGRKDEGGMDGWREEGKEEGEGGWGTSESGSVYLLVAPIASSSTSPNSSNSFTVSLAPTPLTNQASSKARLRHGREEEVRVCERFMRCGCVSETLGLVYEQWSLVATLSHLIKQEVQVSAVSCVSRL